MARPGGAHDWAELSPLMSSSGSPASPSCHIGVVARMGWRDAGLIANSAAPTRVPRDGPSARSSHTRETQAGRQLTSVPRQCHAETPSSRLDRREDFEIEALLWLSLENRQQHSHPTVCRLLVTASARAYPSPENGLRATEQPWQKDRVNICPIFGCRCGRTVSVYEINPI
jgi:hypothetical protein